MPVRAGHMWRLRGVRRQHEAGRQRAWLSASVLKVERSEVCDLPSAWLAHAHKSDCSSRSAAIHTATATMDTFVDMYNTLRDMRKRQLAHQVLNLAMIVCSALMIWKSLMVITESESPVVVVLSGSMEPAFQRGDILFLNNQANPIRVGEVVVFKIKDRMDPCGNQNFGAPRHRTRSRPRDLTHWLISTQATFPSCIA